MLHPGRSWALLQKHLKPYTRSVDRYVRIPASEYQKAALISFSYNVSVKAFEHFSVLRNLNAGRWQQAYGLRSRVYVTACKPGACQPPRGGT
ncbi:glycoside hydrolase family protein [Kosakonia sp. S42]|uniref:glycoside hydrolase family protein n=1 Tax=Kosakonia sp. S42 TaxID=2767458 RepID=UPI001F246C10|nr:glycoside hydrolase family protein [Kosakonia sp. S42]